MLCIKGSDAGSDYTNLYRLNDRSNDIVNGYKELKQILGKSVANKNASLINTAGTKNYLKTTITMQQHGKNRMNKDLLKYALE